MPSRRGEPRPTGSGAQEGSGPKDSNSGPSNPRLRSSSSSWSDASDPFGEPSGRSFGDGSASSSSPPQMREDHWSSMVSNDAIGGMGSSGEGSAGHGVEGSGASVDHAA